MTNSEENLDPCNDSDGTKNEISSINCNFECTYCETSFAGPPQSNEKLQLYKDHLVGFHKISKDINKMMHIAANEYAAVQKQNQKVLTSRDNQLSEQEDNKRTSSDSHTQTCPKDFYRHFMHQEWDGSIDWKIIPKPSISKPKKILHKKKENVPQHEDGTNYCLPVIEKALSLKPETFNRIGMNMQSLIMYDNKFKCFNSHKKKIDTSIKIEQPPSKTHDLNINDWTRSVKSNGAASKNLSPEKQDKSVNLRWEEKDEKLDGKYTFDLIKEPSAKRQKIVVRFRQEQERDLLDSNGMLPRKDSEVLHSEANFELTTDMKDINLPQRNSLEDQHCNSGFDAFVENTNSESIDSSIYTLHDVVQEEVVSSEIISSNDNQEYITTPSDSLSQIINETIGSSTFNNSIENADEHNVIMSVDGSIENDSNTTEGRYQEETEMECDNHTKFLNGFKNNVTTNNCEDVPIGTFNTLSTENAESDINFENNILILNSNLVKDETNPSHDDTIHKNGDYISQLSFKDWSQGFCEFTCAVCEEKFYRSYDLLFHAEKTHGINKEDYREKHPNIYSVFVKMQCKICNRKIAHEYGKLLKHIQGIHNIKLETYYQAYIKSNPDH